MFLFVNNRTQALSSFRRAFALSQQLKWTFLKHYKNSIETKEDYLINYYYLQKVEELSRLSNLLNLWEIFLQFITKKIHFTDLYSQSMNYQSTIKNDSPWS